MLLGQMKWCPSNNKSFAFKKIRRKRHRKKFWTL